MLGDGTRPARRVAGHRHSPPHARASSAARAAARRGPACSPASSSAVLRLGGLVAWLGWFSSVLTASKVEVHGVAAAAAGGCAGRPRCPSVDRSCASTPMPCTARCSRTGLERASRSRRSLPTPSSSRSTPRVAVLAVRNPEVSRRRGPRRVRLPTVGSARAGVPLVSLRGAAAAPRRVSTRRWGRSGRSTRAARRRLRRCSVSTADQVSFTVKVKGATKTVVWGGAGDGARKAELVQSLLRGAGSTIDVSVPSSPVTR